MKHVGDITKLNGAELPIVDVITGGSPCQDLSIAGKRQGLAGERSGLFMEQIRIVKEMRNADRLRNGRSGFLVRPRYMVWENVPGAFSSNKGEDFGAVLTEIIRIEEPEAPDVQVPEGGKWPKAGILYDDMGRWSVAWRVHDAQFWGVPQRRKRIALVADFGGLSAPEILFERKGMRRDPSESGEEREESSSGTEGSPRAAISFQERGGKPGGGKGILIQDEHVGALSTLNNQSVYCLQGNGIDRADTAGCNGKGWKEDISYTLNTIDRPAVSAKTYRKTGHGQFKGDGQGWAESDRADCLNCTDNSETRTPVLVFEPGAASRVGGHQSSISDYTAIVVENKDAEDSR